METVEISVSTQNNWWVERQVQRTYRLERLLNHIFSVILPFTLRQHWENSCRWVRNLYRTYAV